MLIKVTMFVSLYGLAVGNIYDVVINAVECNCNRPSNLDVSKLKLYYFNFETQSNAIYPLRDAAASIKARSDFHEEQCIHVFIPGFTNDVHSLASHVARCSLSRTKCNSKRIALAVIDHSDYTDGRFLLEKINHVSLYQKAISYSRSIATAIGEFMADILKSVKKDYVFASGHSLGGQMVGEAAQVSRKKNYPLKFILAIDPAGPCFKDCPDEHVRSSQADLVMAIHCNAGELGTDQNRTDFDLYSGNGVIQSGCFGGQTFDLIVKSIASMCSHEKCVSISLQTIFQDNVRQTTECDPYGDHADGFCDNSDQTNKAHFITPTGPKGVYFFNPDTDVLKCL